MIIISLIKWVYIEIFIYSDIILYQFIIFVRFSITRGFGVLGFWGFFCDGMVCVLIVICYGEYTV